MEVIVKEVVFVEISLYFYGCIRFLLQGYSLGSVS